MPPALPRPPTSTCALTTTWPPSSAAAARASSGERATRPSETGIPWRLKSSLPWYSERSIGDRLYREAAAACAGSLRRMNAIAVEGLRKNYGGKVQALDGVTFSVEGGEIFGLLGPNGAGKSTTVRVLSTLTRPDEGRATVGGHDV